MTRDKPSARILVLGAGALHKGHYELLRKWGYVCIGMDRNTAAPARTEAQEFFCGDPSDPDQVESAAREFKVDAVLPLSEFGVVPAAIAARRRGLRQIEPESALASHDKRLMRARWAQHDIDQPRFKVIKNEEEAKEAALAFGFPLIIKPPTSSGARGVRRIERLEELHRSLEESTRVAQEGIIIEECMDGTETSVEGIIIDGKAHVLAYGDKELRPHPSFRVTRSINYPGSFTANQVEKIRQVAQACTGALSLDNAPFHLEVFVKGERVVPIECGARGGGGHIYSHIVQLVSGVNLLQLAVRLLLGEPPGYVAPRSNAGACYRFLFPPEGRLLAMEGVSAVRASPSVAALCLSAKVGDDLREPDSGPSRAGCVVTMGSNRQAARDAADWVESTLKWVVQKQ